MRNWLNRSLGDIVCSRVNIGLAMNGIAVLRTSGGWRAQTSVVADQPLAAEAAGAPERLAVQCRSILDEAKCSGMPLHIVLADAWVRLFIVTPPHNAGSLQDCRAAAAMRFQALYGEAAGDWQLSADWDARRPFLACAIPHALLASLKLAAQEARCHLLSVTPHFVAAWNARHTALPDDAWFGAAHDGGLTLGVTAGKRLCAVRVAPIPAAGITPAWLHEHVTREALRLNVSAPARVQLGREYVVLPAASGGVGHNPGVVGNPSLSAALALAHMGGQP